MKTNFTKINMFYGANSATFRTAAMLRKNMTLWIVSEIQNDVTGFIPL
jgi:hypothetical protein